MSKIKTLSHDEIVRYNRMANEVQEVNEQRIRFLHNRTKVLAGKASDTSCFKVSELAGAPLVDMHNVFAQMLANPSNEADATKRADFEKARAEATAEFCSLLKRARNKEEEAIDELNGLWMEQIDLTIRAMCNFLMFFRTVTVGENDQIRYEHTYRTSVAIDYISQDGGPRTRRAVAARKFTYLDFYALWSEEVEYMLRDINLGSNLGELAQKTLDIAWYMESKLNNLAKALFVSKIGAFTTTGSPLARTYVKQGDIVEANLPTTNDLTLTGNTNATLFRLAVIKKIMKYCSQWANVWGAPISPTGTIFVPSLDVLDLADEFTPDGDGETVVAERVVNGDYRSFSWLGVNWVLVPDVTLTPGTCFPVLNQPVGDFFTKPSMDESYVETFPKKNLERRSSMKVVQFASPEPKRVFATSCAYRT